MSVFTYMPGRNDDAARDRAFYLLKKYTSATLLRRAIDLYAEFLRDFEREIARPEDDIDYSCDLVRFLRFLQPMEYARPLLTDPARRPEAFAMLREAVRFSSYIWGRRYEELGADDPKGLFYKLGYRRDKTEAIGVFGKASLSGAMLSLLFGTLNKAGRIYLSEPASDARSVMCWTYESIFFDDLSFNRIPPIVFPEKVPPCPPRNEESEGQVWSGQTIPITGIWEPWSLDPNVGVRCPNYFLAGDTASQYQLEGTDALEDVRWRLIWKDTRYTSGGIPEEESAYFAPEQLAILGIRSRLARAGTTCPESGDWYSPQLKKRQRVEHGDPMPGPETTRWNDDVIWYLRIVPPEPIPEPEDDVIARLGYNPVVEPKPLYCKTHEICPRTGVWVPIVPKDIQDYDWLNYPGNPMFMPLFAEQGRPMMSFGARTPEDEARVVWKWVGENGEYIGRQS
ncbi:Imm72 family immunity protein [Trinickia sp.]|uniref:Imm72 family immunity protein n=1 Tax=Trinickia sp. TaxID=2571163 RepID=UPI003F7DB2C0